MHMCKVVTRLIQRNYWALPIRLSNKCSMIPTCLPPPGAKERRPEVIRVSLFSRHVCNRSGAEEDGQGQKVMLHPEDEFQSSTLPLVPLINVGVAACIRG